MSSNETREEEKRVKTLTSEALARLGRENCKVIVPMPPGPTMTNLGNFLTWTVHITDDDAKEKCRIPVEADPSKNDEQIRTIIIESLSNVTWKPLS